MLLSAPALYWWTHTSVIRASLPELIYWMAPSIACDVIFMSLASRNRVLPVITEVAQLAPAFAICQTVVGAIVRPFGRPFRVTAKGISATRTTVQWGLLCGFAAIALSGIGGMVLNLSQFNPLHADTGYMLNVIVTICNSVVLGLGMAACIEPPRRRQHERFSADEPMKLRLSDGSEVRGSLKNISVGGASIVATSIGNGLERDGELLLDSGRLVLPYHVVRRNGTNLYIEFDLNTPLQRALTKEIYTGNFTNEIIEIRAKQVFGALAKVLLS
jgi:cellulose synthase (UDP-forming)